MEKYLGREVKLKKEFKSNGTFQSMYDAERWLNNKGCSTGSSSATKPTAIMKGDYYEYDLPYKWKNFNKTQIACVHGAMVGDFREGPVTVYIFKS